MTRDDPERAAAMASLTVSEKVKIMPSIRQHKDNERDCRSIVQQLVSSIPQDVLVSTSYGQKEQGNDTRTKTVTFEDQDGEGEKVEQKLEQDCLSWETNGEKNRRTRDQHPGQGSTSGESERDEKVPDMKQYLGNKVLSGEFRWMRRRHGPDLKEGADSITDSSIDDSSRNSSIDIYSDRNSSSGSELSELAFHTLLVETRARDLDREVYQDPDSDRYLIPSERVFDNAADDLETILASKRSVILLPQKEVVRTDLQPFKQETQPLAKIWCLKMKEDTHQPNEMNRLLQWLNSCKQKEARNPPAMEGEQKSRQTGGMGPGGVCSLGCTVGRIPSYATGCGVADHNWITKAINGDRHLSSLVAMSLRFDLEVNPGPGRPWRCTVCTKNLTRRDWSVKCNGCQGWTHWNCTELGDSGRWSKTLKSKCCEPGPFTSETRGYEQKVRRKRERVARRKRRQVKRDAKWRAAFLGKHRNTTVWTWNMQRATVSFPKRNRFTEILRYISKSQAEIVLLSELKEEEPGIKWIKTKDLYGVLVHAKRSGIILRDGWATDWREQGYVREYGANNRERNGTRTRPDKGQYSG